MIYNEPDPDRRRADADRLVAGITAAMTDGDMEGVVGLLRVLVVVDVARARLVHDGLRVALAVAREERGEALDEGVFGDG